LLLQLQPPVSGVAISLRVSGLTVVILSTLCGVFMLQCVKLMMIIFEFGVLLFRCFVYRHNVTCLGRFPRYGHYAGQVENIIRGRLAVESKIAVSKIGAYSYSLMNNAVLKSSWLCFFCGHAVVTMEY